MTARLFAAVWMAAASVAAEGQTARVAIQFEPQSPTDAFVKAAAEYDALWKAEGARMVEAMRQGPSQARVEDLSVENVEPEEISGFSVKH